MANILSGIASKTKALGGKAVDLAGKGALYSQMFRNPNQQMTMGQRVGGALSDVAMNATLGQMGSLGQAVRAGLESRGKSESPTGGSGVPSTTVGGKPIKTENVVQAISQSTQQMLRGLNTLNSTFRQGLNNTTNQIQSQSSVMEAVKGDTEDMDISLREIYEVLNKQGYQDRNSQNLSSGAQRIDGAPVTSQNQNGQGFLQDLLTGALLSFAPALIGRLLPIVATASIAYLADAGLGYLGVGGEELDTKRDKENWDRMNWWQTIESGFARSIENVVGIVAPNMANEASAARIRDESLYFDTQDGKIKNPNKSRAEAITKPNITAPGASAGPDIPSVPNPNKSRAEAIKTPAELSKAEIDEIFRIAPINASDDVLFEIAKQKFPGRKYNTLKQRIQMLRSLMQPQSSLSTGVQLASADMSSGDYLVSRQKMLENSRSGTSEQALRQQEQKLEKDAFEGVIPQLLNYESREMMYKADKIIFDAGKIEFLQSMGMGAASGEGGLIPAGGADNWRPGGTESRDGSGIGGGPVTQVPRLSAETKAAAEQLQTKGSITTLPSQDPLAGYSDEQLKGLGISRKEVRGAKGGREYSYDGEKIDANALGNAREKAEKYLGRKMSDEEYDYLIRATHAESSAGKNADPKEQAMIMGSILNRAREKGENGVITALKEKNQFQAVTGTKYEPGPSSNFRQGPNAQRLQSIEGSADMLGSIPYDQKNFTAASLAAYGPGTNPKYRNDMLANGGTIIGGSVFQTNPDLNATPSLANALTNITPANQQAVAGVGPGNVNVKEAYGPGRPGRPDESIRNIASSAAEKAGMSAITFTSGKGNWISPERRQGGQQTTQHSTGRALDVDGFTSDAERAAFIEEAVSMGANGVGVYKGGSIHIDEGDFRSWDLAKKKIYQDAIARGMEKRKKLQEEKQKQADAEKVEEQKPKVKITEESGQEKAYSKLGVTKESKQKMIAESQAKPAAPPMPPAATPAMLDPTSVQSSQKVSELSKKTTMNREASTKQGPVTQNIVNNSNPKTDTTGTGFPDKNAPMLAMTDTMEKFTSHLFGMA